MKRSAKVSLSHSEPQGLAPRLLRKRDVARYLSISEGSLSSLIAKRIFPEPLVREGRIVLWDKHQLDRHLDRLSALEAGAASSSQQLRESGSHSVPVNTWDAVLERGDGQD